MKPIRLTLSVLLVLVAVPALVVRSDILFVSPDGTGDYPTIQTAVDAALTGDIVELADGVFTGAGNHDIDYRGKAITVRSRNDDPEACVIDCAASQGDPHRGVHFHTGETPAARLEGVTVRNGYMPYANGGGGAIYCRSLASPTLENCVFENNYGDYGGALKATTQGHVTLIGCRLRLNASGGGSYKGGGIYASSCDITATDCIFEGNHAESGGGLSSWSADIVLEGCVFRSNLAECEGGGLACDGGGTLRATDCRFETNRVNGICLPRSGGGGAALREVTDVALTGCQFVGNRIEFGPETGFGGGLYLEASTGVVRTCGFRDNWALRAGGVGLEACDPLLERCTFTGNQAPYGGGALGLDDASPGVTHTIMAFNLNGNAVWCMMSTETPQLDCCDLYGNAGGDWIGCIEEQAGTQGNLCEDPLFCDMAAGNLNLMPESPCAPESPWNPDCGLIGAFPVGCDPQWIPAASAGSDLVLLSVQPNPVAGSTRLAFRVPATRAGEVVRLRIQDPTGRCVRTLIDGALPAGDYAWVWRGDDDHGRPVPSGVYFGRLVLGVRQTTRTLHFLR